MKFHSEIQSSISSLQLTQTQSRVNLESSINNYGNLSFGLNGFKRAGRACGSLQLNETGGGSRGMLGHGGGFEGGNWHYRKLDMPIFEGTDPDGWIVRVERYFAF